MSDQTLTLQDIQRRLGIGTTQAMRVQAALRDESALTRAQAEQRLTDQALRDACSTPPDTSDDEITDMRRRLLDALFGEAE